MLFTLALQQLWQMSRSGNLIPGKTIALIAEQAAGIDNLSMDIANSMAPDVEFRVRELTLEAVKFMRHSKRSRLTTEDINDALRLRHMSPMYGYSSDQVLQFSRAGGGTRDLFYLEDREVDLNEVLHAPLPKRPREMSLSSHWLAVEGLQPAIPQNPILASAAATPAARGAHEVADVQPLVRHMLSREMQAYFERVQQILTTAEPAEVAAMRERLRVDPALQPLMPYFARLLAFMVGTETSAPGDGTAQRARRLLACLEFVMALVQSPYLTLEFYLHQITPAVMTIVMAPWTYPVDAARRIDEERPLRELAGETLGSLVNSYADLFVSLRPRVVRALCEALIDGKRSLLERFGAMRALRALGPAVVRVAVLPLMPGVVRELRDADEEPAADARRLDAAGRPAEELQEERDLLRGEMKLAAREWVASMGPTDAVQLDRDFVQNYQMLSELFGEIVSSSLVFSHQNQY